MRAQATSRITRITMIRISAVFDIDTVAPLLFAAESACCAAAMVEGAGAAGLYSGDAFGAGAGACVDGAARGTP